MNTIRSVCVYCGSSNSASPAYLEAAARLGINRNTLRKKIQQYKIKF